MWKYIKSTKEKKGQTFCDLHKLLHTYFWILWPILQCKYSYFWMEGWTFVGLDKLSSVIFKKFKVQEIYPIFNLRVFAFPKKRELDYIYKSHESAFKSSLTQ
jgi:hypothetical protein